MAVNRRGPDEPDAVRAVSKSRRTGKETMDTPADWTSTPENNQCSPVALASIYPRLANSGGPPEATVRENFTLKREDEYLRAECQTLTKDRR